MEGDYLHLLAANSMNFVSSCMSQPESFVAQNYVLYNILDPVCKWGVDEECTLDLGVSNQPTCPSGLESNAPLGIPVWKIEYGTGKLIQA